MLERLNKEGVLFAFLNPQHHWHKTMPKTSSPLEGGINKEIKRQLNAHTGLGENNLIAAANWLLNYKTQFPQTPTQAFKEHTTPKTQPPTQTPTKPNYTTNIDQDESLHIRKG